MLCLLTLEGFRLKPYLVANFLLESEPFRSILRRKSPVCRHQKKVTAGARDGHIAGKIIFNLWDILRWIIGTSRKIGSGQMEDLKVGDILKTAGLRPCCKKTVVHYDVWFVHGVFQDLPRVDSGLAYLSDTGSWNRARGLANDTGTSFSFRIKFDTSTKWWLKSWQALGLNRLQRPAFKKKGVNSSDGKFCPIWILCSWEFLKSSDFFLFPCGFFYSFAVLDFFHIQSISFSTSKIFWVFFSSRNSNITQVQKVQPVLHLWNQPWMNHQFWKALSTMKHPKHGLYEKSALPGRPSSPPPRYFRAPDSIDWWESPWVDQKKTAKDSPGNSIKFWWFLLWSFRVSI